MLEALHAIGARRVAVSPSPYPDELDAKGAEFLTAHGIEVVSIGGTDLGGARRPHNPLAASPVSHVGLQPPEVAYRLGRNAYIEGAEVGPDQRRQPADADTIDILETDLGVPVVTSRPGLHLGGPSARRRPRPDSRVRSAAGRASAIAQRPAALGRRRRLSGASDARLRARIGLIITHTNTVMEPEFNRLAPRGVSIHTARVRLSS